jgi:Nucleotide modification associated domain 3
MALSKRRLSATSCNTPSPDLHIIFGYLQIGEIYRHGDKFPEYAKGHPHCDKMHENMTTNCIYVAKDRLTFNETLLGAETLNFNKNLVLTKQGMTKGKWDLPEFFKEFEISYHTSDSFKDGYFKSVDRGQEFVIKPNEKLTMWAKELIERN